MGGMGRRRLNESGATLVIVLIIVTLLGLVSGVVLSQVDTSVRTTVGLRDETTSVYGADGAAQYAINKIRADDATTCITGASNIPLNNFIPSSNGNTAGASSAYVTCTPDPQNAESGNPHSANSSPGAALLTLDPNLSEDGIAASVNAGPIKIRGGIFSNSRINASSGINNTWLPPASDPSGKTYNIARGDCLPDAAHMTFNPGHGSTTCNYASPDLRGKDPGTLTPHGASYNPPAPASGDGVIQACTAANSCGVRSCVTSGPAANRDVYQKVLPGRFTNATTLTNLTGCSTGNIWFTPGTYYFDFPAANSLWDLATVQVVAGTISPSLSLNNKITDVQMPTACIGPGETGSTNSSGVLFAFGGASRLGVNNSAGTGSQMAICASNSPDGPPVAIYGLKTALGGSFPVSAEPICSPVVATCALLNTGNSPKPTLTIRGTTYAPNAFLDITLNNNSKKVFYWGLIAYAIRFSGTGSADVSNDLVDVPDTAPLAIPIPTIAYLDVYVCRGAATCSASGVLSLQVKVKISAASPRTVTVLSWSQR